MSTHYSYEPTGVTTTVPNVDDPELWRWIWLGGAVTFGIAELASAGAFFMLPFAVGAGLACLLAFLGAPLLLQWIVFVVVSVALVAALRPLAARLARDHPAEGIGAKRLIGQQGTVLAEIPAGVNELGMVRVHREEWRAETVDGSALPAGSEIRVLEQRGTRVVVTSVGPPPPTPVDPAPSAPSTPPTPSDPEQEQP
jgi:membrane protein implicated in regulation of membrane protease activity